MAGAIFLALRPRQSTCFRHVLFACIAPAALLPGTALLIQRRSVFAVVPVAAVTWILLWGLRTHRPPAPEPAEPSFILSPPIPGTWSPRLRMAIIAGMFLQLTVALITGQERSLAALTAAVATAAVAFVPGMIGYVSRTHRCLDFRGMQRKWLLVFANAFTLTCFALFPHVWGRRLPSIDLPESSAAEEYRERRATPVPPDDDVHQGIIIYPEEQQHVVLVPPMPAVRAMASGRAADPLSVPFFGVYWVWRPPHRQPPPKSLVIRADPVKRNLHSNDGRSLNMEARQNFGTYFEPKCCAALTVIAENKDPQPNTFFMEVFVRDSADATAAPSFIGRHPVGPDPEQRLRFEMPDHLRRFDEVIVSYKMQLWRRDRAPKLSIRRFVFEPR